MNNQLQVLIVDDEPHARIALRGMLEDKFPSIKIVGEAKDIPEAVKAIHKLNPDLVFLDVEMPGYSGLELLDFFEKEAINFKIVFVTAYSEYAINAFELAAVDYLLKPVRMEHLERAINRVEKDETANLNVLKDNLSSNQEKKIGIQTSEGLIYVPLNDILYLKADGSYTTIYILEQNPIVITKKLIEFERIESLGKFMRIHRSHIINLSRIKKITKTDGGKVIMENGHELAISIEKKNQLFEKINLPKF